MKSIRCSTLATILLLHVCLSTSSNVLAVDQPFHPVDCEGRYPHHLQGVCTNNVDAIYWSFTDVLVKTDVNGRIQHRIDVASHHGDLCFHEGKVYVAVNLGEFNQPAGKEDSWVYVYDADTLEELARHAVPQVVHGAGGMAYRDASFYVVGGLPVGVDENYVYEYDSEFAFQKRHALDSGYTFLGIQTAAFAEDEWWFGCYGTPSILLKTDPSFGNVQRFKFNASLGIVGVGQGKLLVAKGSCSKAEGCRGSLVFAIPDDSKGLVVIDDAKGTD